MFPTQRYMLIPLSYIPLTKSDRTSYPAKTFLSLSTYTHSHGWDLLVSPTRAVHYGMLLPGIY